MNRKTRSHRYSKEKKKDCDKVMCQADQPTYRLTEELNYSALHNLLLKITFLSYKRPCQQITTENHRAFYKEQCLVTRQKYIQSVVSIYSTGHTIAELFPKYTHTKGVSNIFQAKQLQLKFRDTTQHL